MAMLIITAMIMVIILTALGRGVTEIQLKAFWGNMVGYGKL